MAHRDVEAADKTSAIDLNSDVGESFGQWRIGDDAAILETVSSANIACGFHAGDPSTISATCQAAVAHDVTIGAHVGYRDLAGFGRRFIDIAPSELCDDIIYQLGALQALAARAGGQVHYVKPHGGLYNAIVHHEPQARAVVKAIVETDPKLPILGLPGSAVFRYAEQAGIRTVVETFADRNYTPEGTLVPRSDPQAMLHDPAAIQAHVQNLAEGRIRTITGSELSVETESICVHGDTPGAVEIARLVRRTLNQTGHRVTSFV